MTGAVIAGGAGTRLRPLTNTRPKPMMPVANKPLVQYQVELMARHGAVDVILCTGIGAEEIERHFRGLTLDAELRFSFEERPLGTAGALRWAAPSASSDPIVAMNGDNLVDYDLSSLLQFHQSNGADATIGLLQVPLPTACGVVKTSPDGRVLAFEEPSEETKKLLASGTAQTEGLGTVNSGIYVLERSALKRIALGEACSIEREFFPSLVADGLRVFGYPLSGYFLDIGTTVTYLQAHQDVLGGRVNVDIAGSDSAGFWTTGEVEVAIGARVSADCHIGAGSRIGRGATVAGASSVGPGCDIADNAVLDGCVILENVVIGVGCTLRHCIIDRDCRIEAGTTVGSHSVLAAGTVLAGGVIYKEATI